MDFSVPPMTPGCAQRAIRAIAWELSERYPNVEAAPPGAKLPPGAKRLPAAIALYKLDARGHRRELGPRQRRGDLDAVDE